MWRMGYDSIGVELWVGRLQPISQGRHDVRKEKEVGEAGEAKGGRKVCWEIFYKHPRQ